MLQNASFLPLLRDDTGAADHIAIDTFEPLADGTGLDGIFAGLKADRSKAAARALAYLEAGGDPKTLTDAAQRLIHLKGTDSHDDKFSSAVIEDYQNLSPAFRNRFLAASVYWLKGSSEPDSPLLARCRAAM